MIEIRSPEFPSLFSNKFNVVVSATHVRLLFGEQIADKTFPRSAIVMSFADAEEFVLLLDKCLRETRAQLAAQTKN